MGVCDSKACTAQHVEAASIEEEGKYEYAAQEPHEELDTLSPRERARKLLAEGTVRLLSATWLMAQGEEYIIQRQQELPKEAFLAPADAAELFGKMFGVVALSYGWLSQFHPDPEGFHMHYLHRYLDKHLKRFNRLTDVGVFWDFAALPQCDLEGNDRTAQEEHLWQRGLRSLSALFGSTHTVVLQLTKVPEETQPLSDDEQFYRSAYLLRGWCFFECTVAALLKDADQLLDLGCAIQELEDDGADWDQVQERARGSRLPPLTPEDMTSELANRQFTNGDDIHYLSQTYTEFFEEAAGAATWLLFENNTTCDGWGDEELRQFVRALPFFTKCQAIRLWGHRTLSEEALGELRALLPDLKTLGRMLLPKHLESTPEGKAVKSFWASCGKMPGALIWC